MKPTYFARAGLAVLLALIGMAWVLGAAPATTPTVIAAAPAVTDLHVVGNQIKNGTGETVRLRGVNRSGMEYACVQGWGIFDGPHDAASVAAIAAWGANVVRIPVNEQCWLGINGVPAAYGGANYQRALADYIGVINAQGLVAIIDLHWAAPGTTPANAQTPIPDRDHAAPFWTQVANAYKGNGAVLFDLFNEPSPDNNQDTAATWRCWRDGGNCSGVGYQTAGMQELVNAVRCTGATNVIVLGGVAYASHLSQWLTYRLTDPTGNLAAAWHIYNFSGCNTEACWDAEAGPVAAQVPLIGGEIGQNNCAHDFIDRLMDWHDAHGAGYLGWTWNTWDCGSGPALISNYDGTPTNFGVGFKSRLLGGGASLSLSPLASPTPLSTPPSGSTVTDDLDDFGKMGTHSANLAFDTTNTSAIGGDPARLVRTVRSAEWAVWGLPGLRSFTATTYAWNDEAAGTFTLESSSDGVTWTALVPTITSSKGASWSRCDYGVTAPTGTNYVRVTFPNSGANAWTPQIGRVTYSAATPPPSGTPTAPQTLAATPTRSTTPTPRFSPTVAASPTATPHNTSTATPSPTPRPTNTPAPSPTPSASPTTAAVHVAAMNGGGGSNQETQYRVRLYNDSGGTQGGLKARIYVNLSELFAAGLTARDVTLAKYWDQCGAVQLGPVTVWDSARSLYYVELTWQGYTFAASSSCEVQFSIHLAGWQAVWNATNDPAAQGLSSSSYLTTTNIPAYRHNMKIYGNEP